MKPVPVSCPCGTGELYAACCEPLHRGEPAFTAEALMRSRYCAYVLKLEAYLLATWYPSTRPAALGLAAQQPAPRWLGLEVRRHDTEGNQATVEFIARYRVGGGRAQRLHEVSRFRRDAGLWFYLDGEFSQAPISAAKP